MSLRGTKNDNVWPLPHILNHVMVVIFVMMIFVPHVHFPLRIYWQDQHPTIYTITAPSLVQDHAEHACQLFMDNHPCSVCAATALREEPLKRHPGTQGKADPIVIHLNDVAPEKDQVNFARKKKNTVPKIIKQQHLQSSMF